MKYLTKLLIPFLLTVLSVISLRAQSSDIACGDTKMTYTINAGTYGDVKVDSGSDFCYHTYKGAIKPKQNISVNVTAWGCVPGTPGEHINTLEASVVFIDKDGSTLPGKNVRSESAYGTCPSVEDIDVNVPKKAKAAIVTILYKSPYYVWDKGWSNQICKVTATYGVGDEGASFDTEEIAGTDDIEGISFGDVSEGNDYGEEESEGFKIELWMIIAASGVVLAVIILVIVLSVSKKKKAPRQPANPYWQPPVPPVYNQPAPGQFAPQQPVPGAPVPPVPQQPEGNPLEQTVYVPQGPDPQNPQ